MPEIIWKGGAEQDLLTVFERLENRREGSGQQLLVDLDNTLSNLRRHPRMAPVYEEPVRRLVVGNSGLGLFYTVEARGIIVHALVHLSQDPEAIQRRIRRMLGWD